MFGVKLITSGLMVMTSEDWSRVRSPSRARRRMSRGHRQNIEIKSVPRRDAISLDGGSSYFVHPSVYDEIRNLFEVFSNKWGG
jgi:hypothetical protein